MAEKNVQQFCKKWANVRNRHVAKFQPQPVYVHLMTISSWSFFATVTYTQLILRDGKTSKLSYEAVHHLSHVSELFYKNSPPPPSIPMSSCQQRNGVKVKHEHAHCTIPLKGVLKIQRICNSTREARLPRHFFSILHTLPPTPYWSYFLVPLILLNLDALWTTFVPWFWIPMHVGGCWGKTELCCTPLVPSPRLYCLPSLVPLTGSP